LELISELGHVTWGHLQNVYYFHLHSNTLWWDILSDIIWEFLGFSPLLLNPVMMWSSCVSPWTCCLRFPER